MLLIPSTLAWMPENHAYYTISQFREVSSPITRLCEGREAQIMFGNSGADVPVIHYLENNLEGYKGTHSRGIYTKCLELAGSDTDLKCVCYGIGLHLIQDKTSHYEFVPTYIKKYFGSNVLIHPIVEINAREQTMNRLESNPNPDLSVTEIRDIAKYALNLFYEDEKYYRIFEQSTGLDMRTDFAMVDSALKGEKWADEVYGKQVNLPNFYWFVSIGIALAGIIWLVLTFVLARNKLAILSYILGGMIFAFGLLLVISLSTGQSWIWYSTIAKVPANIMNIEDTIIYDNKVIENTRKFFETEQLLVDGELVVDASGLDHLDENGNWVKGTLPQAESRFKFFVYPLALITLIILVVLLFWKMSKKPKKRRKK